MANQTKISDAARCRANGWGPGTILEGDEGWGPERILITAVGEEDILARQITNTKGDSVHDWERTWTLAYRKWRRVREASDG